MRALPVNVCEMRNPTLEANVDRDIKTRGNSSSVFNTLAQWPVFKFWLLAPYALQLLVFCHIRPHDFICVPISSKQCLRVCNTNYTQTINYYLFRYNRRDKIVIHTFSQLIRKECQEHKKVQAMKPYNGMHLKMCKIS